MSLENAEHGYDFQEVLYGDLLALKEEGYLAQVVKNFRIGEPGFLNNEQYYSPFLIQFNDRIRWILFTTTSLRTDRIKGQQWDSSRIKIVDGMIQKSLLVYPDDVPEKEQRAFVAQRQKYETKFEYSCIDDIVPHRMLLTQIREKDDEILIEATGKRQLKGQGRILDFSGRNFERSVASILSSQVYLETLRLGKNNNADTFKKFVALINGLDISIDTTSSISATAEKDDIGFLPSGGSPKTDVIVTITRTNGEKEYRTITCKRTKNPYVSAHQYKADAIADLLDKDNEKLRELLRIFQACPFSGRFPFEKELSVEMNKHLRTFCRWVLGGHGGTGSALQNADYIVTFNSVKNKMAVHSLDDYIDIALSRKPVFAGTPFVWTYASKRMGKDIQLKMPVILE